MKSLTPFGVFDLQPQDMAQFDELSNMAMEMFDHNGFRKVRTPIIEYYDVLEPAMGDHLKGQSIRFLNQNGDILVLRPDNTLPIARMVGQKMKPNPKDSLKLSYASPVFRQINQQSSQLEIFQVGVESIGPSSAEEDANIIELCLKTIEQMGVTDYIVEIGHSDFLNDYSKNDISLLKSGDYLTLGHIPERGGQALVKDHDYLHTVFNQLSNRHGSDQIAINKGLVKGFHYYSGIIFEVISISSNLLLASGGRYDSLLKVFGEDLPAIGFSIQLNEVHNDLGRIS